MATVRLTVEQMSRSGLVATYNGALSLANTYVVSNSGKVFLHFKNAGGTPSNVTISTPRTVDGLAVADVVVAIPATTGDKFIGPFQPSIFNSDGDLSFTLDFITSVTVAVVEM